MSALFSRLSQLFKKNPDQGDQMSGHADHARERAAKMSGISGNSAEKVGDLSNSLWRTSPHYNDGERAVMELVDQIGIDANDVSDELWERLREHWNPGQLVELTAVITTFVMIGRVGDALGIAEPVMFSKPIG